MEKTIEIICPLYNAEKFIDGLHKSILMQKRVNLRKVHYILTESKDNSKQVLDNLKLDYSIIQREEFSHSLVRERCGMQCTSEIIVFISQDIKILNDSWLYHLTNEILNNNCDASFSRQICGRKCIEKYTREMNYPEQPRIVTKKDIGAYGLKTFFFSDASSAIKTSVFKTLKGYDALDLPINEDMYIAYKLIMNNFRIFYAANSLVEHSHDFTVGEIYKRYKATGEFFKMNSYLDKYGTNESGVAMAKYTLKRIIQEKDFNSLYKFVPNMTSRYIGMKVGKYGRSVYLSKK